MYCTNPNYIHEFDMMIEYGDVLESVDNSINLAMTNLIKTERKVKYSAMFENADNMYMIEEAQKNLFERIGDGIKSLLTKLANMIKSIFKGNKENELKNNMVAAQQAVANDPSLKDQLITGIKDGKYDIKDISAYTKAYEEASKLLAEGKIDPNTFKGKMELALKKFDEKPKSTVRLTNLNAALLACSGGLLFKTLADVRKNHGSVSDAVDRAHNRFHKMLATKDDKGEYNTALSAFWEATRTFINANANEANKSDKIINTLNDVFKKFSKKTDKDRAAKAEEHLKRSHRGDIVYHNVQEMKKEVENAKKILKEMKELKQQHDEGKITLSPERLKEVRDEIIRQEGRLDDLTDAIIDKDPDLTEAQKVMAKSDKRTEGYNELFKKREEKIEKEEENIKKEKKKIDNKLNSINSQINIVQRKTKELKNWMNKRHTLSELYDQNNMIKSLIQNNNNTIEGLKTSIPTMKEKCKEIEEQCPQDPSIKDMKDSIDRLEASLNVAEEETKMLHRYHNELLQKIDLAKKTKGKRG